MHYCDPVEPEEQDYHADKQQQDEQQEVCLTIEKVKCIRNIITQALNELCSLIHIYNESLTDNISITDMDSPIYADYQTCGELREILLMINKIVPAQQEEEN